MGAIVGRSGRVSQGWFLVAVGSVPERRRHGRRQQGPLRVSRWPGMDLMNQWRLTLPGYGGGVPTLTPDHTAVMYQRSETARLTLISLATGKLLGEVDPGEYFGGEL